MIREKIGPLQEELERFESLKSRFAKLSDLLIQRIFPLTDEIVLTAGGTIFDRIYRTEKRNRAGTSEMIKICELRNLIANEKIPEIYTAVVTLCPALLAVVPKVIAYASDITRRTRYD